MSAFLISSNAKAVLDASYTAPCTVLQDEPAQWPHVDNSGIYEVDNGNHYLSSFQSVGPSQEENITVWEPTLPYGDTSSKSTSISKSTFDDASTSNIGYEGYPETLTSISHAPCMVSKEKRSGCGTDLKHNDVDQPQILSAGPDIGVTTCTLAGLYSQKSATFCTPEELSLSYSVCVTQEDAERDARVGSKDKGFAARWKKGSVLKYIIRTETFQNPRQAGLVAREATKAIAMWQNIGVRFEKVGRDEKATFAIKFCPQSDNCRRDVYARAFFPNDSPDELSVYELALERSNVCFLANILAHEFGHILGLRHEFAVETSFLWGKENARSVMNYFSDLSQLQVGPQDREELATFYECDERRHAQPPIIEIEPPLYRFPKSNRSLRRYQPTSKRLYLNYRNRRVRFRRNPSLTQKVDQRTNSSRILLSPSLVRFYCGFAFFTSFAYCAFFLGRM
ncbi:uncharacterized protein TrAtP1_005948 [Trichoderma atroviride]|uniref:uncharacterized protein n=1 Tax=Hypocrea atroviridis TaxID=63577 RepID=UPI00331F0A8F|nr:hypothetical protein TrAtP1_005948 [Trichoderma atroviride]